MSPRYFLPEDIGKKAEQLVRRGVPLNISLYLEKYVPHDGAEASLKGRIKQLSSRKGINMVSTDYFPRKMYKQYFHRYKRTLSSLSDFGYSVTSFKAELKWRLCLGQGSPSVYETSIFLDRTYGVPIIPGTSVKGVTRSFMVNSKVFETHEEIFGTQDVKGKVMFFDSLPLPHSIDDGFLCLDIMNPHYREYYQGGGKEKPQPGDWEKPVPINFLAAQDLTYRFWLASRDGDLKVAEDYLKKALHNIGIGGKTSEGYGYFTIID